MRIGIDARELGAGATGVGRYLRGLLAEWADEAVGQQHQLVLYAPAPIALPRAAAHMTTRVVAGVPNTWWEQVRLPPAARQDRLDVFFAPGYTAPLRIGVPSVVAIHDVSFFAHPEWFRAREGMRRRWLTLQSAQRAQAVVTISSFSRQEIVERLGIASDSVHVIPPGVEVPAGLDAVDCAAQAPRPDSVLFVGSIFNRRRMPDLIRALGRLARARPDVGLDIVGDDRTYPREDVRGVIAREGLEGRVRWHAYVPDEMLRALYARARAFAFLSEYEGLGLTPLEALAAGVPPVLLDTPVARESCGGAALYVPLGDIVATARALEQALFDVEVRARLLLAAPAALGRYRWSRAAADTLGLIEEAAGQVSRGRG